MSNSSDNYFIYLFICLVNKMSKEGSFYFFIFKLRVQNSKNPQCAVIKDKGKQHIRIFKKIERDIFA